MRLLTTFFFVFSLQAFGLAQLITASGGSPIPIAYDANDSQSKVMICGSSQEVEVINNTTTLLALGLKEGDILPTSDYAFVLAGPNAGRVFLKGNQNQVIGNNTAVYIRSTSGAAITSGTVAISCF